MGEPTTRIRHWHVLLTNCATAPALLRRRTLASALIALTASKGQRQHETALRLNNWRSGCHLPRSGNSRRALAKLPHADDPQTQKLWNQLYRQAGEMEGCSARPGRFVPVAQYAAPS